MSRTTLLMTRVIDRLSLPSIDFIVLPFLGEYHKEDVHPPEDCSRHPDQTIEVPHDEQEKKWWDLKDDRKKQLEVQISLILTCCRATHDCMILQVGGGLLAGAALIGGGYVAWQKHEEHKKTEEEVSFLPHYSDFP